MESLKMKKVFSFLPSFFSPLLSLLFSFLSFPFFFFFFSTGNYRVKGIPKRGIEAQLQREEKLKSEF